MSALVKGTHFFCMLSDRMIYFGSQWFEIVKKLLILFIKLFFIDQLQNPEDSRKWASKDV